MNKKGFTLLELLVVVLIIGILASIALPQYQMAVTKAKVASILPIMRRWKDALQEYKLQHGYYGDDDHAVYPDGSDLGVNWPSDWKYSSSNATCGDKTNCSNDYWVCESSSGRGNIVCTHNLNDGGFDITMYQPDAPDYEDFRDKITCYADGDEAHKICKALGGKLPEDGENEYILY